MTEKPPKLGDQEASTPQEKEPISYEDALTAAKFLRARKVKDLASGVYRNREVQKAWDEVMAWAAQQGLHMRGVETEEKAHAIVVAANLWIEAGYIETPYLKDTLERLDDEYADAQKGGNEKVTTILRDAIDAMEEKLAQANPRESIPRLIEAKYKEAEREIAEGKLLEAIGTLHGTLTNPRFKRKITEEQRERITILRDETKKEAGLRSAKS